MRRTYPRDLASFPASVCCAAALALAFSAIVPSRSALEAQAPVIAPFTVGILREDAVLVPFAKFDGHGWRQAQVRSDGRSWELVRTSGERVQVAAQRKVTAPNHCTEYEGLLTNYRSSVTIEPNSFPLPYAGIAATRALTLQPVADVQDGDTRRAIEAMLPDVFRRLEPDLWASRKGTEFEPDFSRALARPTLASVYRGPVPGEGQLLLFSARRDLPYAADGSRLDSATLVTGSLAQRKGQSPVLLHTETGISEGDKGEDDFAPLASFAYGNHVFWLGTTSSYEFETYDVFEVTADGRLRSVVNVEAGGC